VNGEEQEHTGAQTAPAGPPVLAEAAPAAALGPTVRSRRGRTVEAVPYDFSRPIQLSKGFSRSLTIVGESYAKLLSLSLSNYLRVPLTVTAQGVRQVLFEEHTRTITSPSCINIIELAPIKTPAMLTLDIGLVFAMIEKMLGSATLHGDLRREFTAIEARIARKIVLRMLGDLREAMQRILAVEVGLSAIEHNPEYTYIMNANDPCLLLLFKMELGEFVGELSVCISLPGLDAELGGEGASPYRDGRNAQERREDGKRLSLILDSTRTEVVAELARLPVSMAQLGQLEEGGVLSLRKQVDEPLKVMVGGCPLFLATMGRFKSKSAIKITRVLRPRENPLGGAPEPQPKNEGKR
jgi:flagellar motor switch protein FliM